MLGEMQLVWRFNRGHTDALREIYEQHKHALVTLATALLIDKSEAEDVVHDVFVGFIRSGGRFQLTGSLGGFLATCVANRARNRNKSTRKNTPVEVAVGEPAAPNNERPDLATMFGEELRFVGGALAELPYEQREVVVLAVMQRHALSRDCANAGRFNQHGPGPVPLRCGQIENSFERTTESRSENEDYIYDAGILAAGKARARSISAWICNERATPPAAKRTSQIVNFISLRLS